MEGKNPAAKLKSSLIPLLSSKELSTEVIERLLKEIPRKWEKHGDLIIIPQSSLCDESWKVLGTCLYETICNCLKVKRIARKNPIQSNVFRSSNVELLYGETGIVTHTDNKIKYQWDITKCMFSIGNITEKLRIASFDCKGEVVVDLFAGIGYFVLPYLVHAKARHVYACEINPDSIAALRVNLKINGVEDRCTIFEGDNRTTCPSNIADRVNLGLIPSSAISWRTACNALKSDTGGVLHVHANIDSSKQVQDAGEKPTKSKGPFKYPEWEEWTYNYAIATIKKLLCDVKDRQWLVKFIHLEHVKSYAPHVDHVVLDLDCRPAV